MQRNNNNKVSQEKFMAEVEILEALLMAQMQKVKNVAEEGNLDVCVEENKMDDTPKKVFIPENASKETCFYSNGVPNYHTATAARFSVQHLCNVLKVQQKNCCANCGVQFNESNTFCAHHLHTNEDGSGPVIALLCFNCNVGCGFKDDPKISMNAAEYLGQFEKHLEEQETSLAESEKKKKQLKEEASESQKKFYCAYCQEFKDKKGISCKEGCSGACFECKSKPGFKAQKFTNPEKWGCVACGHIADFDEFTRNSRNKVCHRVRFCKTQNEKRLLSSYGLTQEQHDQAFKCQDGMCLICKNKKATCTDHDHATDLFRALLCKNCNCGLGFFKDDTALLIAMARIQLYFINKYIKEEKKENKRKREEEGEEEDDKNDSNKNKKKKKQSEEEIADKKRRLI